jgi:nucleotide-binding universal stress UspA family protein
MFKRILIAYDDSREACKALEAGMKLAATLHAHTTLLTVMEPLPASVHMACAVVPELPNQMDRERRDHIEQAQAHARAQATHHGIELETMLIEGDEVRCILDITRKTQADLLVLGLHRHAPGLEWQGTMRCIANETPCPILAVC